MIVTGITYKCNFNCLFCLDRNLKGKPSPSFQEIKELFQQFKDSHEDTVMFMTGESFIRPDFLEILKEAKKHGLKIKVTTNGSMLSYYDFLNKIIKGGVAHIVLSLHSHLPKIANAIARNNLCYSLQRKALLNIDLFNSLHEKKINIDINTVINKLNYKQLEDLVLYLKGLLKHTHLRIKFKFMNLGGNNIDFYKKMLPSFREIGSYILKALNALGREEIAEKIAFSGFPLCSIPNYEWACVELQETLYHNNLYLFSSHRLKEGKSQYEVVKNDFFKYRECKNCSLVTLCLGVRKDYLKVYRHFNLNLSRRDPKDVLGAVRNNSAFFLGSPLTTSRKR